jgi:hypothetical protein
LSQWAKNAIRFRSADRTEVGILTGTFILKSSLLNLKAMSERVLWKNPVGRRTRTSCRFAGKDA